MAELQKTTQAGEMTQVFIEFVMMHAQNAALFLGQVPETRGGQVEINLPLAKMFIDQLAVIREKTRGNLTKDEQKVIDSAVAQLQMAFVEVAQMVKAQNLGANIPQPLFADGAFEPEPEPEVAEPPAAAAAPAPPVAPTPPPRAAEPPAEEGRKKFSKSYGS